MTDSHDKDNKHIFSTFHSKHTKNQLQFGEHLTASSPEVYNSYHVREKKK